MLKKSQKYEIRYENVIGSNIGDFSTVILRKLPRSRNSTHDDLMKMCYDGRCDPREVPEDRRGGEKKRRRNLIKAGRLRRRRHDVFLLSLSLPFAPYSQKSEKRGGRRIHLEFIDLRWNEAESLKKQTIKRWTCNEILPLALSDGRADRCGDDHQQISLFRTAWKTNGRKKLPCPLKYSPVRRVWICVRSRSITQKFQLRSPKPQGSPFHSYSIT